jgi:hypothetical protein
LKSLEDRERRESGKGIEEKGANRKRIIVSEGSQAVPACPSGKGGLKRW